jgi:hypothetical protein
MTDNTSSAMMNPCKGTVAACTKCGQHTYVSPLHDERGGPLFCFMCAGAWHAEHAPRRRARRVLIKAMTAYEKAGGSLYEKDFEELRVAASGFFYFRNADRVGDDFSDLTSKRNGRKRTSAKKKSASKRTHASASIIRSTKQSANRLHARCAAMSLNRSAAMQSIVLPPVVNVPM